MLLTHSETVWFLAFAAASIALVSFGVKRTCTVLPFAVPLGSFGLPTFLVFFAKSELLHDSCSDCRYG